MSTLDDMNKALDYVREKHPDELAAIFFGDGSQEHIVLPNGATVIQLDLSCDGPDCQANEFYGQRVWYHLFTVPGRITGRGYRFCSLRCMANWLAGELAKEESK